MATPQSSSAPRRRPEDLATAAATTAYAHIKASVPVFMFNEAKRAAKHEAMQQAFEELDRTGPQVAG